MKRLFHSVALLLLTLQSIPVLADATPGGVAPVGVAAVGVAHLDFRYRLEAVDQQGFSENALASTLRTRANYLSAPYVTSQTKTQLFFEVDNVTYLGSEVFNNTRNGSTRYPVVADPVGTGINQLYLKTKTDLFTTTLGRQRILHDGQRFIGGVGWRQNEQTYDGLGVQIHPATPLSGSWEYVKRVSRIFGPNHGAPPASLDSNSHLTRVHYDASSLGKLTGYGYFLDFEDAPALSTRTVGFRYQNAFDFNGITLPLSIEYAHQNDYADNRANLSLDYIAVDLSLKTQYATFNIGNEILEGSSAGGFQTPLATLHKFQGWTDKFLSTPVTGIDDRYIGISGENQGVKWAVTYHDFDAERGSTDYGKELDLSIARKLTTNISAVLKWARYDADNFSTDTSKAWLMLTASI